MILLICSGLLSVCSLLANQPNVESQYQNAVAALDAGQYEKAYQYALSTDPTEFHDAQHQFDYAILCCKVGCFDHALYAYKEALSKAPSSLAILYNIGYTLKVAGRLPEAITVYQELLKRAPTYDAAHLGLAFAYLTAGDFEKGWKAHEYNLKLQGKNAEQLRKLLAQGTLEGKTILLKPEGGFGDTIMFFRYTERLKKMGATIVAAVQKPLVPLLSRSIYPDRVVPSDAIPAQHYDASATYMTLPALFYDTEETVPSTVPYLSADPALMLQWKQAVAHDSNIKVGIFWQASVHNDSSRMPVAHRGIPLALFKHISTIPGISLYSLQKVDGMEQLNHPSCPQSLQVFDHLDELHGAFMDTAALIEQCDLIITADSAVAQLAGALAKPVWLLLPYVADWRWIHGKSRSPWYPTMRIFKQERPFDWQSIMEKVGKDLYEARIFDEHTARYALALTSCND